MLEYGWHIANISASQHIVHTRLTPFSLTNSFHELVMNGSMSIENSGALIFRGIAAFPKATLFEPGSLSTPLFL